MTLLTSLEFIITFFLISELSPEAYFSRNTNSLFHRIITVFTKMDSLQNSNIQTP